MIILRKVSTYGPKVLKKKKKKERENNHFMEKKKPIWNFTRAALKIKLSFISYFNCDNQACYLLLEV